MEISGEHVSVHGCGSVGQGSNPYPGSLRAAHKQLVLPFWLVDIYAPGETWGGYTVVNRVSGTTGSQVNTRMSTEATVIYCVCLPPPRLLLLSMIFNPFSFSLFLHCYHYVQTNTT